MVRLVCAVLAALSLFVAAARAADDVSGVWSVAGQPDARLLIERQADRFRIAVTDADALGLGFDWYVGETRAADLSSQDISVEALLLRRLFGYPQTSARVLDRAGIRLALTDAFRGSLTIGGRSFDVERKELVRNGLIAALDAEAPETGWYGPDGGGAFEFFEAQGSQAFLVRLSAAGGAPATVRIDASKSGPATWTGANATIAAKTNGQGVVAFALTAGGAAVELKRAQFAKRGGTFVADVGPSLEGPDTDGNGIRDDIDIAIGDGSIASSRLRDGLAEIARSYRAYLLAPDQVTALDALERTERAKTCIGKLAPDVSDEKIDVVESLTFNTVKRFEAERRLRTLAGPYSIPETSISLRNPNECAAFMQGVVRRYDLLSPATLRDARAKRVIDPDEAALSAARRSRARTLAAGEASNVCARTKVLVVTGVFTDEEGARDNKIALRSRMEAAGIDLKSVAFDEYPDPDPGANDLLQYYTDVVGTTPSEAADLIRSGLQYIVRGTVRILARPSKKNIVIGSIMITAGNLKAILGIQLSDAIKNNKADTLGLSGRFSKEISDGNRVIAASHSNGNLRSNRAFRALQGEAKRSIRIASIANAARDVATGGTGATRDDDVVTNFTRRKFQSEEATIFDAGSPRGALLLGHTLVGAYLDNPVARPVVLDRLRSALAQAKFPAQSGDRVIAQSSGGATGPSGEQDTYKIGANGVTVKLNYEAFSIPDRFDVIYRGDRVASTGGLVSGSGTLDIMLPLDPDNAADGDIIVVVYGPDPNTAWEYQVVCPPEQASGAIAQRNGFVQ